MSAPVERCHECPFHYDTIECKAPVPNPPDAGDDDWFDVLFTGIPARCPLRQAPLTIRMKEKTDE